MSFGLRRTSDSNFFISLLSVLLVGALSMISSGCTSSVSQTVSISITPVSISLNPSGTQQFTATVSGSPIPSVSWTLTCSGTAGCGTLSATGFYTAPATIAAASAATVRATASADSSKIAIATVNLEPVAISAISPASVSLNINGTQQFTGATVTGSATNNTAVTWSVTCSLGSNCGSIGNTTGLYTAPTSITASNTVTVTATASAYPTVTSTATVNLVPITISVVSPGTISLNAGETQTFTAAAAGSTTNNNAVTWSVSCIGTCGSIVSTTGAYTAPSPITNATTVTVTATANADPSVSATATITLNAFAISVSPVGTSLLNPGGTIQYTATVTGTSNTTVTWSVTCATACGSISGTGLYTAPATATTDTVTATSAYNNQTATATVSISLANATVDFTTTLATLDPYTFGVDITGYGNGLNITNDSTEQTALTNLDLGMMRMDLVYTTSGNPSSTIICGGSGCSTGITGDQWVSAIHALGALPMIAVSLNASATPAFNNDAVDAANMVTHFNINSSTGNPDPTLPSYVKYWVIGNEPNLATNPAISVATYDAQFTAMVTAMKAVDPNIKVGGPATGGSYTGSGSGPYNYIQQFLTDCGGIVDFVDFHKYDLSGSQWTDSPLRLVDSNTNKYGANPTNGRIGEIRAQISGNATSGPRNAQIGIQAGEFNISSNSGSLASSPEARLPYDFFNVLYVSAALGNITTTGSRAMLFGDKNTALGILSDGTTPWLNGTAQVSWPPPATDSPMPAFNGYAMYTGMGLFRHYGTASVATSTTIAASPNGLDIFASTNGKNIVVVNKDSVAHTVTFALTGYTTGTAEVWQKAAVGGVIGSSDNPGPLYNPSAIQQLSTINITNSGFSVSVPAYSVTTYVLN